MKIKKIETETDEITEQMVINSITAAVLEQRLPARTKLVKTTLSEVFNRDRANVRRALPTLDTMHVVQLQLNRGAFFSTP